MAAAEAPARDGLPDTKTLLERERRERPRAAAAAVAAALLGLAAWIIPQWIYDDYPRVPFLTALQDAAGTRPEGSVGLAVPRLEFLDDNAMALLGVSILQGLSTLALGYVLVVLYTAVRDRGATIPRVSHMLAMLGAVAGAVGTIGFQIAVNVKVADYVDSGEHTSAAAREALRSDFIVGMTGVAQIGLLVLAVAVILISLNAMRAGLLTRFLGVLGIIVGVLMVLFGPAGFGAPPFLLQAFWLLAVALLLTGRGPSGLTPAWQSGEAVPWPSQLELAEQRARAQEERRKHRERGGQAEADASEDGEDCGAAGGRRKRKRRS